LNIVWSSHYYYAELHIVEMRSTDISNQFKLINFEKA